ncbi:MAG: SRPBCC family protein [Xanthomonadales bacterium]|nr:SRPBCC family protein [Xanthomonadales bacterium]
MPTSETNIIEIGCTPKALYEYVSQPWHWHEWHPSSRSAGSEASKLEVGDTFTEVIELQPFSPLPFRMRRQTTYRVLVAEPEESWQVRGETRDGWLMIQYAFEPIEQGTRFTRTLTYEATGPTALLMPFLKKRMAEKSRIALANLKRRMERTPDV